MKIIYFLLLMLFITKTSSALLHQESIGYFERDVELEGYLSYDDRILNTKAPVVILVHEWNGLGDYVKQRADQIAALGYVAFAIDIYGKNIRPENMEDAAKESAIYKNDRELLRRRAHAGLEKAKSFPFIDPFKIVAIGYCFGGLTVLEMARAGEDLVGVVSIHGALDAVNPSEKSNIKAKILVLHGADDPNLKNDQLVIFENEMRLNKVDWQINLYGNAVHAFSNPASGNDNSKGIGYNQKADVRSWEAMKIFLNEVFQEN